MDFFVSARRVAMTAIPVGALGGFLFVLGATADMGWAQIVGVLLLVASGVMWALHGMAEDQD